MMNTKLLLAGFIGLAALLSPLAGAEPEGRAPAAPAKAAPGKVAQALAELPFINEARPNKNARYYIYLFSASWCGPCKMIMPNIVAGYDEMRKSGVAELVLVSWDRTPEAATAYIEHYNAKFPCIMKADAAALPGLKQPPGIPYAVIVDAKGKLIQFAHGSIVPRWKSVIEQYEQQQGIPTSFTPEAAASVEVVGGSAADDVDDDSSKGKKKADKKGGNGAVAKALARCKFLTKAKPNRKATHYIYLCSASWCGPCQAEMPHIAKAYKKMKAKKVELILVSSDRTEEAAIDFPKKHGGKFPVMMGGADANVLPGFSAPQGIPHAIIVDAEGNVLKKGHGSIALDWKEIIGGSAAADDDDADEDDDDAKKKSRKKKAKKSRKSKAAADDED